MYSAPELLTHNHRLDFFDCGEESLNIWLRRNALKNQQNQASRTFVICKENIVVGFYALAAGAVTHQFASSTLRRNMPEPIPVVVLGRLAIDVKHQGKKLGAALLKDVVLRSKSISEQIGVRALLVHALNNKAKQFYLHYGFQPSPIDDMSLMLKL
ncbi:GNAT family N-acetyltransferase [Mergibacter septicus]|uniref:GNAT family N-acetyltransferase n=1 Tax=Mergibacter septicus TaxID=221402 RepID=A0A8E3MCC0_9PAST|nr:GNAT family N-acetyltransferase [Mergibacter septicus]AWX15139.1 GNAT family N-acetyltransferase [Mergibacter septicus]QDJ12656.1 GNAT family N-acetyltransferase [Mergibacter septicus]QDJ14392.1 GNAT family N-acetyltransferase [Mergibacter septicus]UTU48169.1 GNAT family N-acetyltransferase [Mergibacter septicus]WMR96213.1 GNAT family N-acetyltransferase [Mergibacter septicus]